jgi:hypothetical protein
MHDNLHSSKCALFLDDMMLIANITPIDKEHAAAVCMWMSLVPRVDNMNHSVQMYDALWFMFLSGVPLILM